MTTENLKSGTLLTGLLIIMIGTTVHCEYVVKCYNDTGSSICFAAEQSRDTRLRSWTAAIDFCQKLNGSNANLPTVTSPLVQFHLSEFLVDNDFTLDSIWLGGRGVSNGWAWVDGRAFRGSISTSSSMNTYIAGIEKITNGNETQNIFVDDSLSKESDGYICQYAGSDVCDAKKVVAAHYYFDGSSCFARYDESINWYLARNKCLMRGGDLATLTDETDAGIKRMLDNLEYTQTQPVKRFWIGLRKLWWKWASDGSDVKIVYFKDNPALEDGNTADQNCLAVDYKQQFAWNIRNCSVHLQTICQVGGWTETVTAQPTGTPGQSIVSLPAWAVGLICGLAGLIYIVSLIVVGIICCKCCGRHATRKNGDDEEGTRGRNSNSYVHEPRGESDPSDSRAPRQPQPPPATSRVNEFQLDDDDDYPPEEFEDDYYEMPEETKPNGGGVYANPHEGKALPAGKRRRPRSIIFHGNRGDPYPV